MCGRSRGTRDPTVRRSRGDRPTSGQNEWMFAAMGLTGVALYQFLENCAIYYTNASNVAILTSFGPIVTSALAHMFSQDRSLSPLLVAGSFVAICGGALVVFNGVYDFQLRPQVSLCVNQPTTNAVAAVSAERPVPAERTQCEAITKSGKRCSRKAALGERFCRQHLIKSRPRMMP